MSQEQITPTPELPAGVNPVVYEGQQLIEQIQTHDAAARRLSAEKLNYADTSHPKASVLLGYGIGHAVQLHRRNKAKRESGKHYRQNEAAYQEQAVKEATDQDAELNGWDQK